MSNKLKISFLLLLVILLIVGLSKWLFNRESTSYSTWLWDAHILETDMDRTLSSINEMNIQSVYLQYSSKVSHEAYKQFISSLQKTGVNVYALDGAPNWGITNHESKQQFLDWLQDYQAHALDHEQFKGIHLDVEPYLLDNWEKDQEEIVSLYQTLLLQLKDFASNINISLGVDIPFWFDQVTYDNQYGQGYLSQWIIQNTDETTLMAYRDFAKGKNGIIDISSTEVDWAEQANKKIVIAVEAEELPESHTTFYDNDKHALASEIEWVQAHYKDRIAGIAIHSFEGMRTLLQEEH